MQNLNPTNENNNVNEHGNEEEIRNIFDACEHGNVEAFHHFLKEGHSIHEMSEDGYYLLSIVCSLGFYNLTLELLKQKVNVEVKCRKHGCTPLIRASTAGHYDIVKLLLSYGADINSVSRKGMSSLMYVCKNGNVEIVDLLVTNGANLENQSHSGYTPLMLAAKSGHTMIVKILLEHGAIISTYSTYNRSALTLASFRGHLNVIKVLLEYQVNHENVTKNLVTPYELFEALTNTAKNGRIDIAKYLFDYKVDVNLSSLINFNKFIAPPLYLAVCNAYRDLVLLFIDYGADLDIIDDKGYTPLMQASIKGYGDIVFILLYKGASVNMLNIKTEETALSLACYYGHLNVVDLLVGHGANLELGKITPLIRAVEKDHLDVITYLIHNGADVNALSPLKETPLFYACMNGNINAALMLHYSGSHLEHISKYGYTPLMIACKFGHLAIVQFLVYKKVSMTRITSNIGYHTPLSVACINGHYEIAKFLICKIAMTHKLYEKEKLISKGATELQTDNVRQIIDGFLPNFDDAIFESIKKYLDEKFTPNFTNSIYKGQSKEMIKSIIDNRRKDCQKLKDIMIHSLLDVYHQSRK